MPGRLAIDLLLNMRREHTLDSYKLDSVAGVFLRDKVVKAEGARVFTKSTRGLRVNNYVCFDIVGNTSEQFTTYIQSEDNRWGKVIRDAKIKVD